MNSIVYIDNLLIWIIQLNCYPQEAMESSVVTDLVWDTNVLQVKLWTHLSFSGFSLAIHELS